MVLAKKKKAQNNIDRVLDQRTGLSARSIPFPSDLGLHLPFFERPPSSAGTSNRPHNFINELVGLGDD
jgi:hypothetical protein